MTEASSDLLAHRAQRWARTNSFDARVAMPARRDERVSVVLPALDEAGTIGAICRAIRSVIPDTADELIVVDGGSRDATMAEAERAGADVVRAADLIADVPFAGGKGDSMWRSMAAATGDIIVWLDADVRGFDPRTVSRLVAPLLADERLRYVKGYYRRPVAGDPDGGGRVTELLARPLLSMLFPELAGFIQPLAGEYAGRRSALESVPFMSGYSVEVALLIDLLEVAGLDGMAQVDLIERRHRNRRLQELAPMAHAIARTIVARGRARGRLTMALDEPGFVRDGDRLHPLEPLEVERPPVGDVLRERVVGG